MMGARALLSAVFAIAIAGTVGTTPADAGHGARKSHARTAVVHHRVRAPRRTVSYRTHYVRKKHVTHRTYTTYVRKKVTKPVTYARRKLVWETKTYKRPVRVRTYTTKVVPKKVRVRSYKTVPMTYTRHVRVPTSHIAHRKHRVCTRGRMVRHGHGRFRRASYQRGSCHYVTRKVRVRGYKTVAKHYTRHVRKPVYTTKTVHRKVRVRGYRTEMRTYTRRMPRFVTTHETRHVTRTVLVPKKVTRPVVRYTMHRVKTPVVRSHRVSHRSRRGH